MTFCADEDGQPGDAGCGCLTVYDEGLDEDAVREYNENVETDAGGEPITAVGDDDGDGAESADLSENGSAWSDVADPRGSTFG